jgi:hypothetical protein
MAHGACPACAARGFQRRRSCLRRSGWILQLQRHPCRHNGRNLHREGNRDVRRTGRNRHCYPHSAVVRFERPLPKFFHRRRHAGTTPVSVSDSITVLKWTLFLAKGEGEVRCYPRCENPDLRTIEIDLPVGTPDARRPFSC